MKTRITEQEQPVTPEDIRHFEKQFGIIMPENLKNSI